MIRAAFYPFSPKDRLAPNNSDQGHRMVQSRRGAAPTTRPIRDLAIVTRPHDHTLRFLCVSIAPKNNESIYTSNLSSPNLLSAFRTPTVPLCPATPEPSPFHLLSLKISVMARSNTSGKDNFRNCVPQTDKHGDLKVKGWFYLPFLRLFFQ